MKEIFQKAREQIKNVITYFKNLDYRKKAICGVSILAMIVLSICAILLPKALKNKNTETKPAAISSLKNDNTNEWTDTSDAMGSESAESSSDEATTQPPSVIDIENLNVQQGDPKEDGQYIPNMGPEVLIAPRNIRDAPGHFSPISLALNIGKSYAKNNAKPEVPDESTEESTEESTSDDSTASSTTQPTSSETTTSSTTSTTATTTTTTAPDTTESSTQSSKTIPKGSLSQWQRAYGNIYYFDNSHNPLTGMQTIDTVKYRFNNHGAESSKITIDVSSHDATINWKLVREAGVEYAIIRVGYRGYRNPSLNRDTMAERNIAGALANGIKVGLYFYSQAITVEEAVEEASLSIDYARRYKITLPIYFDTEYSESGGEPGRADLLNRNDRTRIARAFCDTVRGAGYQAGVYASKAFFYDELNMSELLQYNIWVAHYTNETTDFRYNYSVWQYSAKGLIQGITGYIDVNICLYDFEKKSHMSDLGSTVQFV